jgi:cyclophilin family peptidyl-prolyl cis-trans isomerase
MAPKKAPSSKYSRVSRRKSRRPLWTVIAVTAIIAILFGVYFAVGNQPPATIAPTKVLLQTTAGDITIDLRTDKPITSTNFINLVKEGKYDGTTFHRVVADFMIQGGEINGSVPTIKDEIGSNNRNANYTIAMANTGSANSASSEFFINVADNGAKYSSNNFDGTYTVFGNVTDGRDVVDAIAKAPTVANPQLNGEVSTPVNPVIITKASILP